MDERTVGSHGSVLAVSGLLLFGSDDSRRALAEHLAEDEDSALLNLLADTARSDESWLLRARCLEVLGLAAGHAQQEVATRILGAFGGSYQQQRKGADIS